jgi:hypothetical protein
MQRLCKIGIKSLHKYHTAKTKNCSGSIDAYFLTGAVKLSLAVLPIKAANTTVMLDSAESTSELPYLQDQTSLTLH